VANQPCEPCSRWEIAGSKPIGNFSGECQLRRVSNQNKSKRLEAADYTAVIHFDSSENASNDRWPQEIRGKPTRS
jgi:hypothetical protein